MAFCIKCGAELPSGANFCMKCGAKVQNVCKKCGKELPMEANFCFVCGTKVGETPQAEQSASAQSSEENLPDPAVDLAGYVEGLFNTGAIPREFPKRHHILPPGKYKITIDESAEEGSGMNSVIVDSEYDDYLNDCCDGPLSFYEENYEGNDFPLHLINDASGSGKNVCGICPERMKAKKSKLIIKVDHLNSQYSYVEEYVISEINIKNLNEIVANPTGGGQDLIIGSQVNEIEASKLSKKYEAAIAYQAWYDYEIESTEEIILEDLLELNVVKDNRFEKLPVVYIDGFVQKNGLHCVDCWNTEYPVREYILKKC